MNTRQRITDLANRKILILDGAMGTMIQAYGLQEQHFRGKRFKDHPESLKGLNDLLCMTQPTSEDIHAQFLRAGADIVETNSFNANAVSLADYGLTELVYELNVAAAEVANAAKAIETPDAPRFVAGVLGLQTAPQQSVREWRTLAIEISHSIHWLTTTRMLLRAC